MIAVRSTSSFWYSLNVSLLFIAVVMLINQELMKYYKI